MMIMFTPPLAWGLPRVATKEAKEVLPGGGPFSRGLDGLS